MFFKHYAKTKNVCKNIFFGHKQCLQLLQNTDWRHMHSVVWNFLLTRITTLRPRQDVRHFPVDIFKRIFLNENIWHFIKISLKFVPRVQLTIFQHWFRKWLGDGQATSHYLNQRWLFNWLIYASLYNITTHSCFSLIGSIARVSVRSNYLHNSMEYISWFIF